MLTEPLNVSLWMPVYDKLREMSGRQGLLVSELSRLYLVEYAREFESKVSTENESVRPPSILGAEAVFPNFLRAPKFRYNTMLEPDVRVTYRVAHEYFGMTASSIGRLVVTRGLMSDL